MTLPAGNLSSGSLRQRHHLTALTSPHLLRSLGAGIQSCLSGASRRGLPAADFGGRCSFDLALVFCLAIFASCSTVLEILQRRSSPDHSPSSCALFLGIPS